MTRFIGEYIGGVIIGMGLGWLLCSMLLPAFLLLTQDAAEIKLPPREWNIFSAIICIALSLVGIFIVAWAARRRKRVA